MAEALVEKARAAGGTVLAHASVRGRGPEHALPRAGLLAATHDSLVFVLGDALNVGEASVLPGVTIRKAEFRNQEAALYLDSVPGEWVFSQLSEAAARSLMQASNLTERYSTVGPHPGPVTNTTTDPAPVSVDHAPWFEGSPTHAAQTHPGGVATPFQSSVEETPALPSRSAAQKKPLARVLVALGLAVFSAVVFTLMAPAATPSSPGASAEAFADGPGGTVGEKVAASEARPGQAKGELLVAATHRAGQAIVVEFRGLPGNAQDWITLVPQTAPENNYNEWFYLKRQRSGSVTFKPVTPGHYEVRVFHNWPAGGYVVHERAQLSVSE